MMKQKIVEAALEVYRDKGAKFTMDDLANKLGMSKKTIYTIIPDKRTLFTDMVNYTFDAIKRSEEEVMQEPNLTTEQRLRKILGVMPDQVAGLDFTQLYSMKSKYPEAYKLIAERLEGGWDLTISLLDQGVKEGVFRPINFTIFQMVYESSLERFLNGSELEENKINYMDALKQLVDLLIDGISID
ncbi:MAG: TetR/AcrR family transcriptional regulator [Lachnospiraceae bacterium]|nr:TetR/AcrR family transcriptional regulator [Lachnospiraceae bacterium]